MATTNFDRYNLDATGDNAREDIHDVITNISPTDVPFQSNCSSGTAENTFMEWLVDSLAAVDTNNALVDGADFDTDSSSPASRLGNYAQISRKDLAVSRRANRISKVGRRQELAYQVAKKGEELRRDVEAILTGNQAAVAGDSSTPSRTASLCAWLKTNTNRGADGSNPQLSQGAGDGTHGFPDTAAGDASGGNLRALSESTLLGVIRDCWIEGGKTGVVMMGPQVKERFSRFMMTGAGNSGGRIATPYQDHGRNPRGGVTAVGAVDFYVSDFGVLDIVPNRFQRERDVFVLDMNLWELAYFDGYSTMNIAKIGDSERRIVLVDYVLRSNNEAGSGVVADIDETAAVVQ